VRVFVWMGAWVELPCHVSTGWRTMSGDTVVVCLRVEGQLCIREWVEDSCSMFEGGEAAADSGCCF
jgi:hypothetical protein